MKKNVLAKDFFREIRGSFNRYLSILLIVALGVAFYAGVRSAEPDMKLSADALYDAQNMMDLRVLSELGITQEDVEALSEIEGVTSAQGGYTADALTDAGGQQTVVSIQSLGDGINQPELTQGRLPESADECFLDADYMAETGIQLGDTITVYADGDADILDTLAVDTFTVVGAGRYAWYLNFDRGTANIGNGDVGFFLLVPQSAFSLDVYTVAYLTCDGADAYNSFDDAYKDYIAEVTDRVEAIADARCQIRYDEVQKEGAQEIADAEQEIADAEQELEDARQELEDAKQELDDAAQEIADGEKEIEDGERELEDAKAQLREKEQELLDGWIELDDAKRQLADAEQELHDARVEVVGADSAISNSRSQLNQQSQQFNAFAGQAETLKDPDAYLQAQNNYALLQQAQAAGQLPEGGEEALQFYDQILPGLESAVGTDPDEATLSAAVDGALQPTRDAIESGYDQLNAASKKVERGREELASAEQEYEDGKQEIEENEQKLVDGQAEIDDAWDEIYASERDLEDARQELEEGRQEYEDGLQEYEDGQAEFQEKSADAQEEIADARQQIADAQKELDELEVPEWYVLDRESIQSYVEYGMDTERIGAIGQVFPAIFFLVAALVSLTTMTRMVEEQRLQIGTMKALGYSQTAIAGKFLGYALSASLIGSVLGIFTGSYLLPYVILSAYGMLYTNMTVMLLPIQWDLSLFALLIAVACTVAATYAACYAEFRSTPAALMRPAAPPEGRRVLLERIPALWKRLSFSQKATFRNLFRYKKRFFMTVFGIGACMGLLLVAFGLRNSIAEIVDK
ncbi:MAG: FtsX-like permease family protein, partial [Candidatus Spyradocola sp.]